MEGLYTTLVSLIETYLEPVLYGSVFLFVTVTIIGLSLWLMSGGNPVDRRLREIAEGNSRSSHVAHTEGAFNVKWIEPFVKLMEPPDGWQSSNLKSRLVRAGIRGPKAINYLIAAKLIAAFALPLLILIPFIFSTGTTPSTALVALLVSGGGLMGFYLPDFILTRKGKKRKLAFEEGFPDAMDMLVVCVEAGLGLDAAIQRVGKELQISHPELSTELKLVSLELRAGKGRADALRALADRTAMDDVRSLTSILIQAEHFGTSVAEALRQHSNEMRTLRLQRAKERAAKLPVTLIFPIIFFIFPALFLVVLGPSVVRIYLAFTQGF
ncbi:MAG: type II secretion system F family protein [Gammaproteobacteria bacterium]|nr:type II secretion system F family protein [Gammaproteobacteria bacterium]